MVPVIEFRINPPGNDGLIVKLVINEPELLGIKGLILVPTE